MTDCFDICQEHDSWIPYHVAFLNESDLKQHLEGFKYDFDAFNQQACRRRIITHGKIGLIQCRSKQEAIDVIRSALADPNHLVHDRKHLDPATPIFIVDSQSGARTQV